MIWDLILRQIVDLCIFFTFLIFIFFFEFRIFSTFEFHQATFINGTNTTRVQELFPASLPASVPWIHLKPPSHSHKPAAFLRCFRLLRSRAIWTFITSWNSWFLIGILFSEFWMLNVDKSRWNILGWLTGLNTDLRSCWKLCLMNALVLETEEVILRKNEVGFGDFVLIGMNSAWSDLVDGVGEFVLIGMKSAWSDLKVDGLIISIRFPVDLHSKTDEKLKNTNWMNSKGTWSCILEIGGLELKRDTRILFELLSWYFNVVWLFELFWICGCFIRFETKLTSVMCCVLYRYYQQLYNFCSRKISEFQDA